VVKASGAKASWAAAASTKTAPRGAVFLFWQSFHMSLDRFRQDF
jgi:hypothetical protein